MGGRVRFTLALAGALWLMALPAGAQDAGGGSQAPDGTWFGFGLNASGVGTPGGAGFRLELGLPLAEVGPGLLSINLPVSSLHGGLGLSCAGLPDCPKWRWNALYFVPEIQWEYPFALDMPHRFSVLGLVGIGVSMYWQYYKDVGGYGTGRDVDFGIVPFRAGAAARFVFESGWFVQVLPVGFTLNLSFGDTFYDDVLFVDNNNVDVFVGYDFWAMAGYRW